MAERKKSRKKLDVVDSDKPTKEEYAVAKHLRFNTDVREAKLVGMAVQCFYASKAVDALLASKWSAGKMKNDALFTNRAGCIAYCNRLLQKGLFHRAEKVERRKDRDKSKKKKKLKEGEKEEESNNEDVKDKKVKKEKKSRKDAKEGDKALEGEKGEEEDKKDDTEKKEKSEEKKKKEKKLKLSMHDDQRFVDGEEIYVWIYDPVPVKTFIIGLLMLLGAIGLCLFPLWPEEVRVGVYYVSLAAATFVGFILSLVVVRLILFCIVWVCSVGKHYFWFLPNLTEDVGFFDSFKPLYKHEKSKGAFGGSEKEPKPIDTAETDKQSKGGKEHGDKESEKEESEEENGGKPNGEFEIVDKEDLDEENSQDEEENNRSEEESEGKKDK